MSCDRFKTGYAGQKYEVIAKDEDGNNFPVGWTDDPTGGALVTMVEKHPSLKDARVIEIRCLCICGGRTSTDGARHDIVCPCCDDKTCPVDHTRKA